MTGEMAAPPMPAPALPLLPADEADAEAVAAAAVAAMGDLDITSAVVPLDGERLGEREREDEERRAPALGTPHE
jgi:hypothetical protein